VSQIIEPALGRGKRGEPLACKVPTATSPFFSASCHDRVTRALLLDSLSFGACGDSVVMDMSAFMRLLAFAKHRGEQPSSILRLP